MHWQNGLPLLHFFKELRVTNFHLKTFNPYKVRGKAVVVDTTTGEVNSDVLDVEHFIIDNCNVEFIFWQQ